MPSDKYSQLRKKAQQRISHAPENIEQMSPQDLRALLYEFEVHRAELEVQNEELRQTQQELEKTKEKYFDLYECAPVAYLSLDKKGRIITANLSATKLLDVERAFLMKSMFSLFVPSSQRLFFQNQINDVLTHGEQKSFELTLQTKNNKQLHTLIECVSEYDAEKSIVACRLMIIDIHALKSLQQELKEKEQKYRHIVENAPSGIYEIDFENMRFLSANEAALQITGHSEQDMLSMNPLDLLTPDSRKRFLKRLAALRRGETPLPEVEFQAYKKDGSTTWVLLNAQFHKHNGSFNKATVVVHDIQKRKMLERKLQRSEKRFRSLAENAPDIIARYDKKLRHLYVSPAVKVVTGIAHQDFYGKTNEEMGMPAALCEKWNDFLNNVFKTGEPGKLEFDFDGPQKTYSFEMSAMPEFSETGDVDTLICISRNITEQKNALLERDQLLNELRIERARLEAIISYAPQGIVVADDQARIIMTNEVAQQIYGYTVPFDQAFSSHSVFQLYDKKGNSIPPRELPLTQSALEGKTFKNVELVIKKPNGRKHWLLANSSPITDTEGNITGAVGVFQDITERRKVYEKQSRVQAQKYARNIVETVHTPILLLDENLKVVLANRSFYWLFNATPKQTIGKYLYELGNKQWDIPELRGLLKEILSSETTLRDYQVEHHFEKIGHRIMLLNAHKMRQDESQDKKIVLSISDVTDRKMIEQQQREYQEKLRALTAELTSSEDKERQRIAEGLHDSVVQTLTATRIQLTLARDFVDSEQGNEEIKKISQVIGQTIEEIRSLSFELSSPMLHTAGLVEAVEWFGDLFQERYKIPIFIEDDGAEKPLTENVRNIMFQAVRELATNVIKHSDAKQVTIALKKVDDNIQVEFRDNGVGFDTATLFSAIGRTRGFGLFNIRERLSYVGGSIEIESEVGKGTWIVLTAPLRTDKIEGHEHGD